VVTEVDSLSSMLTSQRKSKPEAETVLRS